MLIDFDFDGYLLIVKSNRFLGTMYYCSDLISLQNFNQGSLKMDCFHLTDFNCFENYSAMSQSDAYPVVIIQFAESHYSLAMMVFVI